MNERTRVRRNAGPLCLISARPLFYTNEIRSYTDRIMKLGTDFAIFVLFFGIAALDAVQTQNWLRVLFWAVIAAVFLWADTKKK